MPNNIIDFESYKKIGRNQSCPCGSGKKHKHCCYNKEIQVTLDEDAKSVLEIDDPALEIGKHYLKQTPATLYDHESLNALGQDLASSGYSELAIKYLKKAIEIDPKFYGSWLNLAAIYSSFDQYEKSLECIEKVPEGFRRKTIIKANTLIKLEDFEKVAHLYEKAVREEPDFYLPYIYLVTHNQKGSETKNYWIELGFKNIPQNTELANEWAIEKFSREEYGVLASDKRISRLKDQSEDPTSIIGGRNESIHQLNSAKALQKIASMISTENERLLPKTVPLISDVSKYSQCEVASTCIAFSMVTGVNSYIDILHSFVCDDCKLNYSINEIKFTTLRISKKLIEAKEKGQEILDENNIINDLFYVKYLSLLDDLGETEEALLLGSKLESKITSFQANAEFCWDMGWYAASLGEWKVVHIFLSKFSKIDADKLLNFKYSGLRGGFPRNNQNYFDNKILFCDFQIAISLIAQRKFDEAMDILNSRYEHKHLKNVTFDAVTETTNKDLILKLSNFLNLCKENSNDKYYLNFFQKNLEEIFNFSDYGGKITKIAEQISTSSAFSFIQSNNLSNQIHGLRFLQREELKENSDFSDIINSLEKKIPQIRLMPDSAYSSIVEAERRIQDDKRSFDSAPTILAYAKSLELTLRHIVFGNFRNSIINLTEFDTLIDEAKDDKNFSKFSGLIKFLDNGRIELGVMRLSMLLSRGKTAKRVKILGLLQSYLDSSFPFLLEEKTLSELEDLVSNYRNEATHERGFNQLELEFVRSKTFEFLKMILGIRAV